MNKAKVLFVCVLLPLLFSCCSRASAKQTEAVESALKSLGKLKAATEVGVNVQQYGQLLIEAKAAVNQAVELLPDGELKKTLNDSMQAYQDAHTFWTSHIAGGLSSYSGVGPSLMDKYKLESSSFTFGANVNEGLTVIWNAAELARQKALEKQ